MKTEAVESVDNRQHEMTRFGVHLMVEMNNTEIETKGSPQDWPWDRIVDKGIGESAFTSVEVRTVIVESKFVVNDDGDFLHETTYSVEDKHPSPLEKSFDTILGYAQDYIADSRFKYGGSEEEQRKDLTSLTHVRDFARNYFLNPNIGDSHIDNFVQGLPEESGVKIFSLITGKDITDSYTR